MRVLKYVPLAVALVSLTVLTGCNSTEGQAASTAAKGNPATQQPASAWLTTFIESASPMRALLLMVARL